MGLHIAHVLGSLGMGGAERVVLDLAVVQRRLGHDASVFSLSPEPGGALTAEFAAAGVPVHWVPKRPGLDFTLPRRVARSLRELAMAVVHTHNTLPLIYAAPPARFQGMRVVHTKHGEGFADSKNTVRLSRAAAVAAHEFVAVSAATAEHARANWEYPRRGRIRVVTNGIRLDKHRADPEARRQVRQQLGIGDTDWVIGTVGRIDANKNHAGLLRAVDELLAADVHAVVVGDGPAMDEVRAIASRCSRPESVHVLGRRDDVSRVMTAFDAFALPSLTEGLPLVILEAMATSVPIVATAVGGIPGVIEHEKSGLLVPVGDDGAMRQRLAELIRDRDRARALGAAGRALVLERFSAERMAREYLELYALARG